MPRNRKYVLLSLYLGDEDEKAYLDTLKIRRGELSMSAMLHYFVLRGIKADKRDGLLLQASHLHPDPDVDGAEAAQPKSSRNRKRPA